MFKKLIPGLVIAIGVALVAGGAALAFGGGGDPSSDLLAKVAERLGLEPSQVEDAFAQARSEQADEDVGRWLDKLVEAGTITQDQSDQALTWFKARPDSTSKMGPFTAPSVFHGMIGPDAIVVPGHIPFGDYRFALPDDLKQRLADALGIDAETLDQALSGATTDTAKTARINALKAQVDRQVQAGMLTEDEGTELKAWIDDIPDWLVDGSVVGTVFGAPFDHAAPNMPQAPQLAPNGFDWQGPGGSPRFRYEGRPHFQFSPGVPNTPTPTPEAGNTATGISRSA